MAQGLAGLGEARGRRAERRRSTFPSTTARSDADAGLAQDQRLSLRIPPTTEDPIEEDEDPVDGEELDFDDSDLDDLLGAPVAAGNED